MAFSIRLNEDEEHLAKSYAAINGISVGEAFKRALFERIEDEYDVAVGELAYKEFLKDPKTYSFSDAMKILEDMD